MASTDENNPSTAEITPPPDDTPLVIPLDAGAALENDGRTCKYCNKTFKKQSQYDVHALKQPCLNPQFKTNCLVCNIVMATRQEYEQHVIGREHFNMVAGLTNRDFKWQPASKSKYKKAAFTINYENDTTESFEVPAEEDEDEFELGECYDSINKSQKISENEFDLYAPRSLPILDFDLEAFLEEQSKLPEKAAMKADPVIARLQSICDAPLKKEEQEKAEAQRIADSTRVADSTAAAEAAAAAAAMPVDSAAADSAATTAPAK